MEKDRKTRVIAIIVLCIAVVGLSIGFAAFTKDLNIQFSDSNVNVSGDLDIKFLASDDPNDTSTVISGMGEIFTDLGFVEDESIVVNPLTISSDGTTISGVGGTVNSKEQIVGYTFYVYNNSEYDAYLKSVEFLNYPGYETNTICTAQEGTNQSLVDDACEDIYVAVVVDGETIIDINKSNFTSFKIPKGNMLSVAIGFVYVGDLINDTILNLKDSALLPNGDFKVNFGDIKFNFSSVEG